MRWQYLHVADAVADAVARASFVIVQAMTRLVGGATVARPGTRTPVGPGRPFRLQQILFLYNITIESHYIWLFQLNYFDLKFNFLKKFWFYGFIS